MLECIAATAVCVYKYWLCRGHWNEVEEEKNVRTMPTLWGVVYQTHLQCNEHTAKIGRECKNECERMRRRQGQR